MEIVKSERPPKSKPEIILATTAKHLDNHAKVNADIHPKIGGGGHLRFLLRKEIHISQTPLTQNNLVILPPIWGIKKDRL